MKFKAEYDDKSTTFKIRIFYYSWSRPKPYKQVFKHTAFHNSISRITDYFHPLKVVNLRLGWSIEFRGIPSSFLLQRLLNSLFFLASKGSNKFKFHSNNLSLFVSKKLRFRNLPVTLNIYLLDLGDFDPACGINLRQELLAQLWVESRFMMISLRNTKIISSYLD
ncbi:hypothetical protein RS022_02700 [Candidatus Phytoplasma rubi]|uniref:Uncharacterized protein n=1 Tax=Candidatus Phytoplasma rubi TaxID=399025 RepID=A0ABY7BTP5_9MOLU|nr:hypothetical protein RS022_02700 [Candidatus Phytoplasma rubi]